MPDQILAIYRGRGGRNVSLCADEQYDFASLIAGVLKRHGARAFANASSQMREQALTALEQKAGGATAGFYAKMRWLVIGGYYTSDAGFADICYIGNQPISAYTGASDDVRGALERAAHGLGLGALT